MKNHFRLLALAGFYFVIMSCHSLTDEQHEWIYEELPLKVWDEVCGANLSAETTRLGNVIIGYSNENLKKIDEQKEDDYEYFSMWSYSLANYTSEVYKNARAKYLRHCKTVLDEFASAIEEYITYKDSSIVDVWDKTDQEICDYLVPYPQYSEKTDVRYVAENVVKRLFKNLQRPVVSACEYDKEHKCWVVRFDNADTHYVRFLKRDDGGFDTEYSSEIFD